MVGEFVMKALHARTNAHVLHLKSRSYARHVALGDFYDALVDLLDGYVEAYQGAFGIIEDYPGPGEMKAGEVMVRKDRRPRNTPQFAHDFIDEWFNERFGFKARSEGLFVIGNPAEATGYGTACIVLPIGEFSTYSSTKIEDLTQKLFPDHNWEQNSGPIGGHSAWPAGDPDEEQQLQLAKIVLDGADYEKNDIVGMAKNTKMEIMIDCDKFVAIYAFSLPNALKILREL